MQKGDRTLPSIPEKLYFSIGEVAQLCDVVPSVLRYWEREFSILKPMKGKGGRRCYQKKDILVARKIRELLYAKRFTVAGAKKQLRLKKLKQPAKPAKVLFSGRSSLLREKKKNAVGEMIGELKSLLKEMEA